MRAVAAACMAVMQTLALPIPAITMAHAADSGSPSVWRASAEAGHAQAQFDLGTSLLCGRRSTANVAEAARWMALAAAQGHPGAQSVLGWMHMTATGVPRNDVLAANVLQRAAEQGDTAAQNNLGVLYARGQGVALDRSQAARWFSTAAEKGADDAAHNLEMLRGSGVSKPQPGRASAAPALHPAPIAAPCSPRSTKKAHRH